MALAGRLRHRLRIEQVSETQNSLGEPVETWSEYRTVYAAIEPLKGREVFLAAQVQSEVQARARIRFVPGVTTKMRAVHTDSHGSTTYNIVAVIDRDLRHVEMELLLAEGLRD